MPKVTVWLKKQLYEEAKRAKVNFSEVLREALKSRLGTKLGEVEEDPELVLKVKCPFCSWVQLTSSTKVVRCIKCERKYRVFPKRKPSAIVDIVKGDFATLQRMRASMKRCL